MVVLSSAVAKPFTASAVSSAVAMPRMTSTNFIIGTGFMKCRPMTCAGRFVSAAMRVMEMEEVLLARIAAGLAMRLSSVKTAALISKVSGTASMMRSQLARLSRLVWQSTRASASAAAASVSVPLATRRARERFMVLCERSSVAVDLSTIMTVKPDWAATCAIPVPICPPPTTPTLRISLPIAAPLPTHAEMGIAPRL